VSFFGSLRLALILIILIALAAALGTFIPQNPPPGTIEGKFGGLAPLLFRLQFTNLYSSPWFLGLLLLFALNLLACSLPRSVTAFRRVFRPQEGLDARGISACRIRDGFNSKIPFESARSGIRRRLADAGWRVHEKTGDTESVLRAGKKTAGRLGSSLVHLGLLVILVGGLATGLGGFRERIILSIGETAAVTGRDMEIRLDDFTTEYHPEGGVKAWKSMVTVLENGAEAESAVIRVNHPLTWRGMSFYLESTGWDWRKAELDIRVGRPDRPEPERFILSEGLSAGLEDGTEIRIRHVVPDFFITEDNEIGTRTFEPRNPAVLVEGQTAGGDFFQAWLFSRHPESNRIRGPEDLDVILEFRDVSVGPYAVLGASRDPGVPLIWSGCGIIMAGLLLVFYYRPRDILIHIIRRDGGSEIRAGGSAAKGREQFAGEFSDLMTALRREP
jgi:cytochrome c biogenesis protein